MVLFDYGAAHGEQPPLGLLYLERVPDVKSFSFLKRLFRLHSTLCSPSRHTFNLFRKGCKVILIRILWFYIDMSKVEMFYQPV